MQHDALMSPSEIYNEDERALMDSIEKDFVQMSLPGAVMWQRTTEKDKDKGIFETGRITALTQALLG